MKNLHSGPKGGNSLLEYLKEYDMEELEKEDMMSATPGAVSTALPAVSIPTKPTKQAIKLQKPTVPVQPPFMQKSQV